MRQLEILRHKFPIVNLSDSLPSIPQKSHSLKLQVISKPQPEPTPVKKQERSSKIDLSSLKEGLTLERTSDRTLIEYYLKAWHKNTPLSSPAFKKLGSIACSPEGFMVATIGIKAKVLKQTLEDAIDWIFRQIGTTYALVYEAYIEAIDSQQAIA